MKFGVAIGSACLLAAGLAAYGVASALPGAQGQGGDWPHYGGSLNGDRYSPLRQITPGNVRELRVAWTYRAGGLEGLKANSRFTATPIKVGRSLYLCTPDNVVIALDAETGQERWRHDPKVDASRAFSIVCRGVSHHAGSAGPCADRILEATLDARLLALDASTGRPCEGFGDRGSVDLAAGLETRSSGYYYVTSPPTVIGDVAVLGGYIVDNQRIDAPTGVVRAFDVRTGALVWAWDAGRPDRSDAPPPGETYSPGNANAWTVFSADPKLGLVYVPTGNSSPDFFGGMRTPAAEQYSTSIVALDVATGRPRWSFQAVHHDVWDYDMPAQPTLVDVPAPGGGLTPVLLAPAKTGEVFMLDRRNGKPVAKVEERKVPQDGARGERLARTQPVNVELPSFAPADLTEKAMWGATPLDQLLCRIRFRELRYEGRYTPPSLKESIFFPGTFGMLNWGGVSVDPVSSTMIVNSSSMPFTGRLVPRAEANALGAVPFGERPAKPLPSGRRPIPTMAMQGTPYGLQLRPFLSPLGFPCHAPPWGELTAVDLATRRVKWRRPFGGSEDTAPFGLALPVGIFNLGGSVTTAGGVTFLGAAVDGYLRAFDLRNGRELWRDKLPAGGQATPLSYAGADGRQYVVIVAGGHGSLRTRRGDYVVAYALPRAGR